MSHGDPQACTPRQAFVLGAAGGLTALAALLGGFVVIVRALDRREHRG